MRNGTNIHRLNLSSAKHAVGC